VQVTDETTNGTNPLNPNADGIETTNLLWYGVVDPDTDGDIGD
jgi:hypothetical protein